MFNDFAYEIARQRRQQLRRAACRFRMLRGAPAVDTADAAVASVVALAQPAPPHVPCDTESRVA